MPKTKTTFFCQHCGAQAAKWIGKCPSCNEWNTYVEEVVQKDSGSKSWKGTNGTTSARSKPQQLADIDFASYPRIPVQDKELDRVLGGGIVAGSLVLVGGEPGIGKSTLMLQMALQMSAGKVLYVSGEESEQQIKMRAERIGGDNSNCFVLAETGLSNIFTHIRQLEPSLVVIDSIQTLQSSEIDSSPGSVSQIRQSAGELLRFAKESQVPVILIGHITKDGSIAGPKVLEHMVDTVLQFEGDRHHAYRILRTIKNRFGSASEIGIYEMRSTGMHEVSNPSEVLISQRSEPLSGIAVAATIEGVRPLLIEVQALVSSAVYGTPQRSSTGFDLRRLNMLLAVLEKRCGFKLGMKDVFLNIAGGLRVDDPAIDLAVICAVLSSNENLSLDPTICFAAEVGLSGEVRPANRIDQRVAEAQKLGFGQAMVSEFNRKSLDQGAWDIELIFVKKVDEAFARLFG